MQSIGYRACRPAFAWVALALCATLATAPSAAPAGAQALGSADSGVLVVVHPSNSVGALSREQVSRLFLRKVARWPDGVPVFPVDQRREAAVREAFTRSVHRRSVDMLTLYWQRQVFSGRQVPPPENKSDAAVLDYVRSTPGAIGYVSADTDVRSVKVVQVLPD